VVALFFQNSPEQGQGHPGGSEKKRCQSLHL